jgi:hypothetical protein
VLYPFVQGAGRFALGLVGLTGSGKSFAAKPIERGTAAESHFERPRAEAGVPAAPRIP